MEIGTQITRKLVYEKTLGFSYTFSVTCYHGEKFWTIDSEKLSIPHFCIGFQKNHQSTTKQINMLSESGKTKV